MGSPEGQTIANVGAKMGLRYLERRCTLGVAQCVCTKLIPLKNQTGSWSIARC